MAPAVWYWLLAMAGWLMATWGWGRARMWREAYERALTFAYHSDRRADLPEIDRDYYRQVIRGGI
jgi:hypothetical protein